MARVTVEDCIENVSNRFDLVIVAAQRAKQISSGAPLTVDRDNDKDGVVALREIADRTVDPEVLEEEIIQNNTRRQAKEEFEAVPFAGEIEDHVAQQAAENAAEAAELQNEAEEETDEEPQPVDVPQDLSFEDENIDIED